jgi:hypothetical protein
MNTCDYLCICSLALIALGGVVVVVVVVVMLRRLSHACGVTRKGFVRQAAMSPPKTIPAYSYRRTGRLQGCKSSEG